MSRPVLLLVIASAACGRSHATSDPRLDVALAAPASSRQVRVPGLMVTRDPRHAPHGVPSIERQLDGVRWTCAYDDATPDRASVGRASCAAIASDGDRIVVPFALREGAIGIDDDVIHIEPADANDPTDARAAIEAENARLRRTDLRVVDDQPQPGGYAAIVLAGDGLFDPEVEVWVHLQLGARDVTCGSIVETRAEAERGRALCLGLREP